MKIGADKQDLGKMGEKKEYTPLPGGTYVAKLKNFAEETTKAGNGAMISAAFEVSEGEHENRLVFERFIIDHPKKNVKEIGLDRLSNFIKAAGVPLGLEGIGYDTDNLNDLVGKNVALKVVIEESAGYKPRNKITSFYSK